jgi:hypothetical protein
MAGCAMTAVLTSRQRHSFLSLLLLELFQYPEHLEGSQQLHLTATERLGNQQLGAYLCEFACGWKCLE